MRRVFRLPFGRAHIAREVDDELAFHLEMRTQKLMALGLSPDAARREALRQFGDVDGVKQNCVTLDQERDRAMYRAHLLDELRQDLGYAARTLRRNVGFTVVVVLTLAFGIGANTAIFSLIDAMLLRQLPVKEPQRLVAIGDTKRVNSLSDGSERTDLISYPVYRELREQTRIVTGLLASGRTGRIDVVVDRNAAAEHPRSRLVSGNYFQVLGVRPAMGRVFDGTEDDAIGAAPFVTISYGYWLRRFGADPSAIGRSITINGSQFTIIGIAAPGFTGEIIGAETEMWIPIMMQTVLRPSEPFLNDRKTDWLLLLGRLAPGVTMEQASEVLGTAIRQSIADHAPRDQPDAAQRALREKVYVSSGAKGFSRVRNTYAVPLMTLMAGVGVLLLIICANVATLLLARAIARGREMSVRLALGAARSRLVRQLLTESLFLAMLSAVTGLLVAWYGSRLLLVLAAEGAGVIPLDLRLDVPVLVFTAVLSAVAVLLFGLAPALRASRVDLASSMRDRAGAVSFSGRGQRIPIGRLLIGAQVALSLVLLMGAALLVRSLRNVQSSETGLDRDRLLIVDVDAAGRDYRNERLASFARDVAGRLARLPGVSGVAYSQNGIFSGTETGSSVSVPGFIARTEDDSSTKTDDISAGYVRTTGAHLLQGREFTEQDGLHAARVAIVNESFARFYFGGSNPIGRTIVLDDSARMQVVGVVGDVTYHELDAPAVRRVYVPYSQLSLGNPATLRFIMRSESDPALLAGAVRREIAAANPLVAIGSIDPLSRLMRQSIAEQRLVARLATGFGVLSMLLAAIGLYGVMTYAITRRTGEIGLRVALGAQRADVLRLVLFDAIGIVIIGVVIGIPLALVTTRLLRSQLHGIGSADPVALGSALFVLATSALLAALLPALRATRVAPLVALRQE